ncbi:MAG: hypothetical protein E5Y83_34815 [Mesorhizobium sp.]|nr:MAG: hypothetical protein E5Y85_34950 [Mesorhizobium sp.]TIL46669.1 MAG: hypothetical protein E5Y83_34815 [Mesorhizobium sp.]
MGFLSTVKCAGFTVFPGTARPHGDLGMNSPGSRLSADVIAILRTRALTFILSVLVSVLTARYLGADGKGLIAALMAVPGVVVALCELGARQSASHFLARRILPLPEVLGALSLLALVTSSLGVLVTLVYLNWTASQRFTHLQVALACSTIPLSVAVSYVSGVFLGLLQIARFNAAAWIPSIASAAVILLLVGFLERGPTGVLWAQVISGSLLLAYALRTLPLIAALRLTLSWRAPARIVRLGIVYAVALFALTLNYRISVILLTQLSTFREVGIFSLGNSIATLVWVVPGAIGPLVFAHSASATRHSQQPEHLSALTRITLAASAACGLGLALVSPIIVPLVYGASFSASSLVVLMLMPGAVCFAAFKLLNVNLAGQGKPWLTLVAILPALALNALLGYVLVPLSGSVGAAQATSISYVVGAGAMVLIYCRSSGQSFREALICTTADVRLLRRALPGMLGGAMDQPT